MRFAVRYPFPIDFFFFFFLAAVQLHFGRAAVLLEKINKPLCEATHVLESLV